MNPFAELPTWVAVLVALLAGGVLIALNLGWLMAAKSLLDTQRQKNRERRERTASAPTSERGGPDRSGRTPII